MCLVLEGWTGLENEGGPSYVFFFLIVGGGLVAKLCPTLAILEIVAHQAPLSMGFSRQIYWSGLPWPPPGDLPNPGIEPTSPALAGGFFNTSATWEAHPVGRT